MSRFRKTLLLAWLAAIAAWIVAGRLTEFLDRLGRELPGLGVPLFFARLAVVCIAIYWIAIAIRYLLYKLFWRVGRRLALSYFLIGVLPFLLFAALLVFFGYAIGGLLSQAAYRSERQSFLTRMDQWNLEYAIGGGKPASALSTLQIRDARGGKVEGLPEWLATQTFSGVVLRDKEVLLISARLYDSEKKRRSVVFVQPLGDEWAKYLEQKNGMIVSYTAARERRRAGVGNVRVETNDGASEADEESTSRIGIGSAGGGFEADLDDSVFNSFFRRTFRWNGVIWADLSPPLVQWETGEVSSDQRVFTLIWNPWEGLIESFFFGSSEYAKGLLAAIGGVASMLLLIYIPATLLAVVLIFSISRAVNRIEKGTHAVERGDFSYRIGLKPRNQLGQMAQSFDRMTESISTLLIKVAEKERLQSEIDIAASIQRNLLPKDGPAFRGVSFSAHFEPTAQIGGDYYDVFNLDHRYLAVAIGDVSGHGLSTGLVMAMVKAAMTTLVEQGADEASLFQRLNHLVYRSTDNRAFMTLAFTIFDLETGRVRHTNAGHLYPYVLRQGFPPIPLESPSLPLGVRAEIEPQTIETMLQPCDSVVYLSDGIVEAQNDLGDPLGFEALEQVLTEVAGGSPAEIQEALLAATARHSGGRFADDDRTIMILRFDAIPDRRIEHDDVEVVETGVVADLGSGE